MRSLLETGVGLVLTACFSVGVSGFQPADAQDKKPNILLIVSDDTGWGDLGPYLGGEARGHADPELRPTGAGGHGLHQFLRPAELHAGARRDPDRAASPTAAA